MGILRNFKMHSCSVATIVLGCLAVASAVTPLTPEELQQIRDFTAKAHMKRLQAYPDQIMTPTTHYMGRRIPPSASDKQPNIYMQAPTAQSSNVVKPTQTFVEHQTQQQNYLINYPITTTTNSLNHQQQAIHHQFQRPQPAFPFIPQNAPNGPLRGPPPQFGRRPSFLQLPDSAPSIFNFFFPKRSQRRPSFRPPLRFEYPQSSGQNPSLAQHHQNLHSVMAQQHLLTVAQQQQQQQAQQSQQSIIRPSTSPLTNSQSTTLKNSQATPTTIPSSVSPSITTVVTASTPTLVTTNAGHQYNYQQNPHPQFFPLQPPPLHLNQFHREISFFGKPLGKPIHHHPKYQTVTPAFVPQNRPGDADNYIQKYVSPAPDFSFFPQGPHIPSVIAGPTSSRLNSPVSFTHIEQMPFAMQQSPPLPMHMVLQSQEFPNYHFTTTFTASDNGRPSSSPASAGKGASEETTTKPVETHAGSTPSSSTRQIHRIKKIRTRPSTVSTSTLAPSTTQSLGDIIFESSKETREFHDSARISPSNSNGNNEFHKIRKTKSSQSQRESHDETVQKASAESSVVLAPLVFTEESSEPISTTTTTSPKPSTTTSRSNPTIRNHQTTTTTTTTQEPTYKQKIKSKHPEFQKSKNIHHHTYEKRVTASGAGLSAVTPSPYRSTSTSSSSKSTVVPGGRVVTTSVTSRVVSIGPNPQKRYRLRKVKLPNPELKKSTTTTSISTSASTSVSSSSPTTTPYSTSVPSRSTTTASSTSSSTEGSSTSTTEA